MSPGMRHTPMKNFLSAFLFLFLISWPRPAAAQYAGIHGEHLYFSLPADWQVVHGSKSDDLELIRKGDDINNWKELVTVQDLPSRRSDSPQAFLEAIKARREKECPGVTRWNVIQQDEYSMVYEWQLTKPCVGAARPLGQHELARVVFGKYNIFRIRYATVGQGLITDVRAKWISRLSSAAATIDASIDQTIPFTSAQILAALTPAMRTFNCKVTKATSTLVECKRPWTKHSIWLFRKPRNPGGEKVTAVLESHGNQTRVRITTGFGFSGNLIKENWSYPVFHQMMAALRQPPQ
ncbi:MAG TPA: hypothetical protein VNF02_02020 [Candidatus Limnocylindrales bacterium]|nr:hypothetical protein [Candidatus Limnocylindrales bacterium]